MRILFLPFSGRMIFGFAIVYIQVLLEGLSMLLCFGD